MALEFNKLVEQIRKMGRMLQELDFDQNDRLQMALERFQAADDLDAIHRRIEQVRSPDISGYRGAAPLDPEYHEPICQVYPRPPIPERAIVIAADGSQVYPSEQWRIPYYLTNIGIFVYHHGEMRTPQQQTLPRLVYHPERVRDRGRRVVSSRTIDAQRTLREMQELGNAAWELRGQGVPLVALYDNHLIFWASADVSDHIEMMKKYQAALVHLHDAEALLAGYVDNPTRSRLVIRLLHLLSLDDEQLKGSDFGSGELEGLKDIDLFNVLLEPGERSALMVQNSPRNLKYRQRGKSYEIAFFYVKVSSGYQSAIARIDVPMWVARDRQAVDQLHGLIVAQCALQGRNPYPYALTRADELAVVSSQDKRKLEEMIRLEWHLNRPDVDPMVFSAKLFGKRLARSPKRPYEV